LSYSSISNNTPSSIFNRLFSKAVENWPVKVLSLGLAIILFIFHRMSILETRYFFSPLNIEHLGVMMPSSPYSSVIRVSLRGEADSVRSVLEDDIEVFVDMSAFNTRGSYFVPVEWRKRGPAQGLEALQITVEPREIYITLDYRISKLVPLVPIFQGQPESGYAMLSYSLNPSQVTIDGPAEQVAGIYELYTDVINLNYRRSGDFSERVNILNDTSLVLIRGDGIVEFRGSVGRFTAQKHIPAVPLGMVGLADGFVAELETPVINLYLQGEGQEIVDRFVLTPYFVRLDGSGITEEGTYVLGVLTGTAEGIFFTAEPNEITVRIRELGDF
jgi:hypothetical protein